MEFIWLVEALNIIDLGDFLEQVLMNLTLVVQMYRNNEVDPNVRATEQELFEGLEAKSVNCWPSVQFDIGAINNFLKQIFYQQVFITKLLCGQKAFGINIYEPIIRKAAGFGAASIKHDKERYEHKYEYCDLINYRIWTIWLSKCLCSCSKWGKNNLSGG